MEVKDTWASQEDSSSGTPTALVDTLLKSLEVEELKKTDTLFEESVEMEMNELKQSDTLLQESFDAAANIIEPSKPRMGTVKQVKPVKSIFKKVVPIFILA